MQKISPHQISYSVPQASAVTSIGTTSIYKAINEGKLKAKKFGIRTLILRSDLEAFLESHDDYQPEPEQ